MTLLSPPAGSATRVPVSTTHATLVAPQSLSRTRTFTWSADEHAARRAIGLIAASIALLVVLQLGALGTVDPLRGTISGMVYAPGGFVLFAAMGVLCVTGSAILAVSLVRFGSRKAAVAVGIWCVALAVAAVVPTDPPGVMEVSLAALIHRDAAAVMFAAMPVAGLLVAAHPFARGAVPPARQRAVRRASIAAAVMGVLQIAVSIPSLFPDAAVSSWPAVDALYSMRGLAERALFVALLVVLVRIAAVVSRASAANRSLAA